MKELIPNVLLLVLLAICLYTDVREAKIYNKYTLSTFFIALIFAVLEGGLDGLKYSLAGAAVGMGIMLAPYFLGGLGAGDVKLLMAIGALKGANFTFQAALATFIAGGIIAVFLITYKGQWKIARFRLKGILFSLVAMPILKNYCYDYEASNSKSTFPYGIAIAAGTLFVLIAG